MRSLFNRFVGNKPAVIAVSFAALLLVVAVLSYIPDLLTIVLLAIFIVAPIFRVHASFVLWQGYNYAKSQKLPTGAILERFFIAVTGSVSVVILATLGFLRVAFNVVLPQPVGPTLTAVSLVMLILPAFVWEYMYLTGRLER